MKSSESLDSNDSPKLTTSKYEDHKFTHRKQNRETLFPVKLTLSVIARCAIHIAMKVVVYLIIVTFC